MVRRVPVVLLYTGYIYIFIQYHTYIYIYICTKVLNASIHWHVCFQWRFNSTPHEYDHHWFPDEVLRHTPNPRLFTCNEPIRKPQRLQSVWLECTLLYINLPRLDGETSLVLLFFGGWIHKPAYISSPIILIFDIAEKQCHFRSKTILARAEGKLSTKWNLLSVMLTRVL